MVVWGADIRVIPLFAPHNKITRGFLKIKSNTISTKRFISVLPIFKNPLNLKLKQRISKMESLKYYGLKREEINQVFLTGSKKKVLTHASGLVDEVKKQFKNNNMRLANLNLDIIKLMIEYANEGREK